MEDNIFLNELADNVVLNELADDVAQRLGFSLPPATVLMINRAAYDSLVANGLDNGSDFKAMAKALEVTSAHVLATQERWARHGSPTSGWWWGKLENAYTMYWDAANKSTGFFISVLQANGIDPPAV